MGAFLLYGFLFNSLIFIRIMNLFSDPSFIQISLVLLLLTGIAIYVKQYKAIVGMIAVYLIYIAVSGSFFTDDLPEIEQKPIMEKKINDTDSDQTENKENDLDNYTVNKDEIGEEQLQIENEDNIEPISDSNQSHSITKDTTITKLVLQKIVTCQNVVTETRSPEGSADSFPDTVGKVYCFTMTENMGAKQSVTHEWSYEGVLISIIPMEIGRSHYWRAWSYQTIQKHKTGNWSVAVRDYNGNILSSAAFIIISTGSEY